MQTPQGQYRRNWSQGMKEDMVPTTTPDQVSITDSTKTAVPLIVQSVANGTKDIYIKPNRSIKESSNNSKVSAWCDTTPQVGKWWRN